MYDKFFQALAGSMGFGLAGIVLTLLGFKLFDWITPRIDVEKELVEKNIAVAIVVAGLLVSVGLVAAQSIS